MYINFIKMQSSIITENEEQMRISKAENLRKEAKERLLKAEEEAILFEKEAFQAEEEARISRELRVQEEKRILEFKKAIAEEEFRVEKFRIEEELRITEEICIKKELQIEEEIRLNEENRIADFEKLVFETQLFEKNRLEKLADNAGKNRLMYENKFTRNIDEFIINLIQIEKGTKLTEKSYQYSSNSLLNFANGLCRKISMNETPVNPLLRELSGFIVQYYKEQVELPEKLNLPERLEEIEKGLITLEKYLLPVDKEPGSKAAEINIRHSSPHYTNTIKKPLNPYVLPGIEEDRESYIYKMGAYIDAIKHERYLEKIEALSQKRKELKEKHAKEVEHLDGENKKRLKIHFVTVGKMEQTNAELISKLLATHSQKESELELQLTPQEDILLAKLKEFIEFESQFNNNLSILMPEKYMYIPYRIKEYETQRNIQQKWINNLHNKISPLRKVIVELKKIIKKQSDEYSYSNICDCLVKNK